jgi:formiminotetrahydrofolate cyclodeaminase
MAGDSIVVNCVVSLDPSLFSCRIAISSPAEAAMALGKIISIVDHDIRNARMALVEDIEHATVTLQVQIGLLTARVTQLRADVDKLMELKP